MCSRGKCFPNFVFNFGTGDNFSHYSVLFVVVQLQSKFLFLQQLIIDWKEKMKYLEVLVKRQRKQNQRCCIDTNIHVMS